MPPVPAVETRSLRFSADPRGTWLWRGQSSYSRQRIYAPQIRPVRGVHIIFEARRSRKP